MWLSNKHKGWECWVKSRRREENCVGMASLIECIDNRYDLIKINATKVLDDTKQ